MKKNKNLKRNILLSILVIVFVLLIAFVIMQRDNIDAAIKAFNYSEDEINEMVVKSREQLEKEVQEKLPDMVSNFTEEEEKKIATGEISVEDAVKKKQEEIDKKISETSANTNTKEAKTNRIVNKKLIEFYSLKAYYLGQLGQLESKVKSDYMALPASKKNLVGKKEVASKYLSVATSLLYECDSKMDTLLKELEGEIKSVNGDLSIINTIKNAYENEKNLKKAYYMSKLK